MAVKLPFCIQRPDRPGYWFDRRVPKDCQAKLGRKHWRLFAGSTITEARRRITQLLAETDAVIASTRGHSVFIPKGGVLTPIEDLRLLQGSPERLLERVSHHIPIPDPEEVDNLLNLSSIDSATVLAEDLISLAIRIKRPAQQTIDAWWRAVNELTDITKVSHFNLLSKTDAQHWRDTLLSRGLKTSTVKLRANYISGLLRLASEESLLPDNVFDGLCKRLRADRKSEKVIDIVSCDSKAKDLPELQYLAYTMLRYSGCRLAEVLGLHSEDIDLDQQVIRIRPYSDRPLKTQQSERTIPLHLNLRSVGSRLKELGDRPFHSFLKGNRWGGGITWGKTIGVHPHGLRHYFATVLREEGVGELIISKLLGHIPTGQTAAYGKVPFKALADAVAKLR